jgi:hypothetical protein
MEAPRSKADGCKDARQLRNKGKRSPNHECLSEPRSHNQELGRYQDSEGHIDYFFLPKTCVKKQAAEFDIASSHDDNLSVVYSSEASEVAGRWCKLVKDRVKHHFKQMLRFRHSVHRHKDMHTLDDAADNVQRVHRLLKYFDKCNMMPNKNEMRICIEHCFLKSASIFAEDVCFEAAKFALDMMEKHNCRFDLSTVTDISLSISLRATFASVVAFVHRLVQNSLAHLPENVRSFVAGHMVYALSERKAEFEESVESDAFSERGLKMDWEKSSSQELHLYNSLEGHLKSYKPVEGYGFAKKGLVAILSMESEYSMQHGYEYKRQSYGAIVDIISADDDKPLKVRMRTQVPVPFQENATYRLDNIETGGDHQARRIMESLCALVPSKLAMDSHNGDDHASSSIKDALCLLRKDPQYAKSLPHPYICQMLYLPSEEQYIVQIVVRKDASLAKMLDRSEYGIRVRCVESGPFMEWNLVSPGDPIRVGDRVLGVNGANDTESIWKQIEHADQVSPWSKSPPIITLVRKVKAQAMPEHAIEKDCLLPNAEEAERVFAMHRHDLAKKLNPSQLEGVRLACTQRLSLIQGPPGTGKTTTAVELLAFLVDHKIVPTPILVSAHTNAAVDNLLVRLAKKGKKVVRIGDNIVLPDCLPYARGGKLAADPKNAEVICATCSGSGSEPCRGIRFHTVLIDECSQATESSCLIPLCHAAEHVILVGDQCQLEPFIKSEHAKSEDLGTSLFNRLCRQGVVPTMLDTQYRMHPVICEFPSEAFYNGQLQSGTKAIECRPTQYWEWPSPEIPVCFVDAKTGEETSSDGKINKKNEVEVELVMECLKDHLLRDPALSMLCEDGTYPVGIITPYAGQVESITMELKKHNFVGSDGKLLIEVNSIDGFQGREKEIIIFSAVRANDHGSVGFLNWRRINVMLTRAKRGLIVFGHRDTLNCDECWSNWLEWAAMRGCIRGEDACGTWIPTCLVEDEWMMKPTANPPENAELASDGPKPLDDRTKTYDSWDDSDAPSDVESSAESVDSKEFSPFPNKPWRAKGESLFLGDKTTTVGSWEELDTSSEGPAEGDQEPSEASFCTHSESDFSYEGVDAWQEQHESSQSLGPLDRVRKDADSRLDIWEEFQASSVLKDATSLVLKQRDEISRCDAREKHTQAIMQTDTYLREGDGTATEGLEKGGFVAMEEQDESRGFGAIPQPSPIIGKLQPHEGGHGMDRQFQWDSPLAQMAVVFWMPVLLPEAWNYPAPSSAAAKSVLASQPTAATCSPSGSASGWLEVSAQPAAEKQEQTQCLHHQAPRPQPQIIACVFDAVAGVHETTWHADARKLEGKDRSIVSPAFHLAIARRHGAEENQDDTAQQSVLFKLMLTARGNGFAKSKGMGTVKVKCEGDVHGLDACLTFTITVGTDTFRSFSHDFALHPIAEMQKQAISFRPSVDPSSNTLCVHVAVTQTIDSDLAADSVHVVSTQPLVVQTCTTPSPGQDNHEVDTYGAASGSASSRHSQEMMPEDAQPAAAGRKRSEAGQQRQWERWQVRRANRR